MVQSTGTHGVCLLSSNASGLEVST